MACILGIDPGTSGAYAVLDLDGELFVDDLPIFKVKRGKTERTELDLYGFADRIRILKSENVIQKACIEWVSAMPGQGVSSMFGFGRTFGALQGIVAALQIPIELVTPVSWKKALNVPKEKDGARKRASEVFPAFSHRWMRVKDDGRAEAALIAYYGTRPW